MLEQRDLNRKSVLLAVEAEKKEGESNPEEENNEEEARKKALHEFWSKTHELYGDDILEQMSKIFLNITNSLCVYY